MKKVKEIFYSDKFNLRFGIALLLLLFVLHFSYVALYFSGIYKPHPLLNDFFDKDKDGLIGFMDNCPYYKGTSETYGCPTDSDGDGVPDNNDKCPNTPKGVI